MKPNIIRLHVRLDPTPNGTNCGLWVETPGGDTHSAYSDNLEVIDDAILTLQQERDKYASANQQASNSSST